MSMDTLRQQLEAQRDESRAIRMARYFQATPGGYADGEVFWGIPNPVVRHTVRQWYHVDQNEVEALLCDPVHECRFAALVIWVRRYGKSSIQKKQAIFDGYVAHLHCINNWDLVDLSARDIVGRHLFEKDRGILYELAERAQRVAIIATFYFLKKNEFDDAIRLAELLLPHPHHLIHKAIGWVLREIGKRDLDLLEAFLHQNIHALPRTSLRYAIEKLPPSRRHYYLTLR